MGAPRSRSRCATSGRRSQKVEYSLDAQRWQVVYPRDGIFDSAVRAVRADARQRRRGQGAHHPRLRREEQLRDGARRRCRRKYDERRRANNEYSEGITRFCAYAQRDSIRFSIFVFRLSASARASSSRRRARGRRRAGARARSCARPARRRSARRARRRRERVRSARWRRR